jgi:hypothetical protein
MEWFFPCRLLDPLLIRPDELWKKKTILFVISQQRRLFSEWRSYTPGRSRSLAIYQMMSRGGCSVFCLLFQDHRHTHILDTELFSYSYSPFYPLICYHIRSESLFSSGGHVRISAYDSLILRLKSLNPSSSSCSGSNTSLDASS